jgi:hypothetical protein
MLRSSMQTLKHIVLTMHVGNVEDNPLFGIPSEFEDMRNENIVETVTIFFWIESYRRGDNWGTRLDEVLATPGWVSLKRVSLVIQISNYFERDIDWKLAVEQLRKLPETDFPRLSSSNSVSFDFKAIPSFREY